MTACTVKTRNRVTHQGTSTRELVTRAFKNTRDASEYDLGRVD